MTEFTKLTTLVYLIHLFWQTQMLQNLWRHRNNVWHITIQVRDTIDVKFFFINCPKITKFSYSNVLFVTSLLMQISY